MNNLCSLNELAPGLCAVVVTIDRSSPLFRRFSDLGITPGVKIRCISRSPLGDPSAYSFRGAVIAIRRGDARHITVDMTL